MLAVDVDVELPDDPLADAGGVDVVVGGYHPPPLQTHPGPGWTVVHCKADGAGAGLAAGWPPGRAIPGGYHPPAAQTQPGPG